MADVSASIRNSIHHDLVHCLCSFAVATCLGASSLGCDSDLRDKLGGPMQLADGGVSAVLPPSKPADPASPDASVSGSDNYTAPSGTTPPNQGSISAGDGGTTEQDGTAPADPVDSASGGASNAEGSTGGSDGLGGASAADAGPPEPTQGAGTGGSSGAGGFPALPDFEGDSGAPDTSSGGHGGDGTGGADNTGAAGASGPTESEFCHGEFFTKLTAQGQTQDFYLDFGLNTVDLSNTTITLRLRADYPGTGGGIIFFLKSPNGGTSYFNWINLIQLGPWAQPTLTPEEFRASPTADFNLSQVNQFGFQITSGDDAGATWGDVTLLIDSITFSDHPDLDMHFEEEMPPFETWGNAPEDALRLRACESN